VDANTVARLEHLNDCKKVTPLRRAALLPVILEVADVAAIVVIPAAQIDRDGLDVSNMHALGQALEAVAVAGSVNLVDWFDLQGAGASARRVVDGDRTSAAIAAASIVAKETHDQLMRALDREHSGYGFAEHKGYGTPAHAAAIRDLGRLSPAHRLSVHAKAYAAIGVFPTA
jgi:ribonuclease HII